MASIKFTSVPPKVLSQSILSTGMSFILSDILGWDGNALTSADFGTQAFGAFISADRTVLELFEWSPSTIADSSITILYRGLKFDGTQTTEVTANKRDWSSGSTTVQLGSDIPQLLALLVDTVATQTIGGLKTFTLLPKSNGGNATEDTELVTYAQAVAMATGTTNINRIVVAGNGGETLVAGDGVYLDSADGEWKKMDANTASTVDNIIMGIAQGAGTDGGAITNGVLLFGLDSNQTGLTTNTPYYVSDTAGEFSSTPGTTEVSVGISRSTTSILFYPRYNQQLTEDQQDALAGTSGTPSSTNKYVTNDDTATTSTADKIVRANGSGKIDSTFIDSTSFVKFGGDGADGALNVTSGTTTIDLSSAAVVEKNYTSINVSAGATLAFSNPATNGTNVILRSQGNVTIAGTITANFGSAGGEAKATAGTGNSGSDSADILDSSNHYGTGGAGNGSTTKGDGGVIFDTTSPATRIIPYTTATTYLYRKSYLIQPGAGGASGGNAGGVGTSGAGGRGGGALVIECNGAWNFTGSIAVDGTAGSAGSTDGSNPNAGGGGGGGGMFLCLYNTLTASSGTVTKTGGNGGAGGSATSGTSAGAGGGGGGGSILGAGGDGGAGGAQNTNGTAGSAGGGTGGGTGGAAGTSDGSSTGGCGGGGGGGAGSYLIAENIWFA